MLCQICGEKEATVHFTEVVNNQIKELHLCEDCAQEKGLSMQPHFSIADLLVGLINLGISPPQVEKAEIKCKNCGLSHAQFAKIGRLGCSECYQSFAKTLVPLLRKIHGSIQHRGKFPKKGKGKISRRKIEPLSGIEKLKAELVQAVEREEFEKAAKIRDKIRALEKKETNS